MLVAVRAISVNPVDFRVRRDVGPGNLSPRILGYDAAGVVDAVAAMVAAAAEACQKDVVAGTLSALAKVDEVLVRRILESGSAKAVTALA